jgi:hypothetical protein
VPTFTPVQIEQLDEDDIFKMWEYPGEEEATLPCLEHLKVTSLSVTVGS